ncbi:MAG: hypothetical protein Q8O84_02770 [Nanoarchaeota archaeon]|nr:hypothetical protein [Nanoarchaeota archaeon]
MEQTLETEVTGRKLFLENGKPKLNLTPLEKTAINAQTQEKHDELMQIYEAGKWRWNGRILPTNYSNFIFYKEKNCVEAGISCYNNLKGFFGCSSEKFYKSRNWKLISINEFYEMQGIIKEDLFELNKWFDENKPNRASKGK